jgi:DNA repair exonuclease SbcCD ATPase subunit
MQELNKWNPLDQIEDGLKRLRAENEELREQLAEEKKLSANLTLELDGTRKVHEVYLGYRHQDREAVATLYKAIVKGDDSEWYEIPHICQVIEQEHDAMILKQADAIDELKKQLAEKKDSMYEVEKNLKGHYEILISNRENLIAELKAKLDQLKGYRQQDRDTVDKLYGTIVGNDDLVRFTIADMCHSIKEEYNELTCCKLRDATILKQAETLEELQKQLAAANDRSNELDEAELYLFGAYEQIKVLTKERDVLAAKLAAFEKKPEQSSEPKVEGAWNEFEYCEIKTASKYQASIHEISSDGEVRVRIEWSEPRELAKAAAEKALAEIMKGTK